MTTHQSAPANEFVLEKAALLAPVVDEMRKVIVGQDHLVNRLVMGLVCDGHLLIEGVPGLAKTLAVQTLADAIEAQFRRVQFTPDLLPADLIGTMIYNPREATFTPRLGPVFTDILLADEINRAPAKVQSALLEAMQERQVSIGGETHPLGRIFMVLATQNPIEHEGTYPLPEAQVDRFMMKVIVGYPTLREEKMIMDMQTGESAPTVERVATIDTIVEARSAVRRVHMEEPIKDYIVRLVAATREPENFRLKQLKPLIAYGASPRASIFLALTSRANALMDGRDYVMPDDVKDVAPDVLRHRVIVTYEAEAEEVTTDEIVRQVLDRVPVP